MYDALYIIVTKLPLLFSSLILFYLFFDTL